MLACEGPWRVKTTPRRDLLSSRYAFETQGQRPVWHAISGRACRKAAVRLLSALLDHRAVPPGQVCEQSAVPPATAAGGSGGPMTDCRCNRNEGPIILTIELPVSVGGLARQRVVSCQLLAPPAPHRPFHHRDRPLLIGSERQHLLPCDKVRSERCLHAQIDLAGRQTMKLQHQ